MREDHILSAIQFLQEPEVVNAPLAKKVEFLESKGLTNDEINEAIKRSSSAPAIAPQTPPVPSYMTQQPPPIPTRDWKDYFVMATVSAGVLYGVYECTKRYILPMILPPTPPQLEQDLQNVNDEFEKMFELVQQVQKDTNELKNAELERTATFDAVMEEARKVILEFKQHVDDHRQASKLSLSNIETLRDTVPRALKQHSESQSQVVDQLKGEIESLKTLISRRQTSQSVPPASAVPTSLPFKKEKEEVKETKNTPFVPDPRIPEWQKNAST